MSVFGGEVLKVINCIIEKARLRARILKHWLQDTWNQDYCEYLLAMLILTPFILPFLVLGFLDHLQEGIKEEQNEYPEPENDEPDYNAINYFDEPSRWEKGGT